MFVAVAAGLVYLWRQHEKMHGGMSHEMEGDGALKTGGAYLAMAILAGGVIAWIATGGAP